MFQYFPVCSISVVCRYEITLMAIAIAAPAIQPVAVGVELLSLKIRMKLINQLILT